MLSFTVMLRNIASCSIKTHIKTSNSTTTNDDDKLFTYKQIGCDSFFSSNVMVLFVITLLFTLFTCCMLIDQSEAITTNVNKIGRMQKGESSSNSSNSSDEVTAATVSIPSFNEIFGGDSTKIAWHWLLPLPVRFNVDMADYVKGYCVEVVESEENEERKSFLTSVDDVDIDIESGVELTEVKSRANSPRKVFEYKP